MGRERVFPARSAWTRARRSGLLLGRPQERLLRPRPRSGGGDPPAGVVRVDGERRARVRPPPTPPPPTPTRGVRSPEASPGTHAVSFSKSRWVRRRGWTGPCFRGWPGRARPTLQRAFVGLGRRMRLCLTPPHLPESRSGGGDRLGPSWVPHLGRSGSRPGAVPGRGPLVSLEAPR